MTLYEQWKQLGEMPKTQEQQLAYWNDYFAAETENYKKILANSDTVFAGSLREVAERFGMTPIVFTGFIDGINTSLVEKYDLDALTEDSPIALNIDYEALFFNMLEAKAKWLSSLPEWEGVLSPETRREITKKWRQSKQAVREKTVGRNDPCPCGSGKKYKKCCGAGE